MTTSTINYFNSNIDGFFKAADTIRRHCIRFAGRSVRAPQAIWPTMVLTKAFSACEPALRSYTFDATLSVGSEVMDGWVVVGTDASVRFIPKHGDEGYPELA